MSEEQLQARERLADEELACLAYEAILRAQTVSARYAHTYRRAHCPWCDIRTAAKRLSDSLEGCASS